MSRQPFAGQSGTQQSTADPHVPDILAASKKQILDFEGTALSTPSTPEGKIVGPFEQLDISRSPQAGDSPLAQWVVSGFGDSPSEGPSTPAEILASSTPDGAAQSPQCESTSSKSALATPKSDVENKLPSGFSPSGYVAKPSKLHLSSAEWKKTSQLDVGQTEKPGRGDAMVDDGPAFVVHEDSAEVTEDEKDALQKLRQMLIDSQPTTTAAKDSLPTYDLSYTHFPPLTNTTGRPVKFFSAPKRSRQKDHGAMLTDPEVGKKPVHAKLPTPNMGTWDSGRPKLRIRPAVPDMVMIEKEGAWSYGFHPPKTTATGPPKQENIKPTAVASTSRPNPTHIQGKQELDVTKLDVTKLGTDLTQIDPAKLVPFLGYPRAVRRAIAEQITRAANARNAPEASKPQVPKEPVDKGTYPKPEQMQPNGDRAVAKERDSRVFPTFPNALCPAPVIRRQWIPDGYLVDHISHIPSFLQKYQPRTVYAMFECSFVSSDCIENDKVPMRIGRLSLFIPIQMRDGTVITVGLAPFELFHTAWKGTDGKVPRPDTSVLGMEAYEIKINGRLKADWTCDRNLVAPTGRIIGTTFGLVHGCCILKIEDWFLEGQKFKEQSRPVPVLDRPVPKDAEVVRYAETRAYDQQVWERERRREHNTRLSVAGLRGIPDNQPRNPKAPPAPNPGVIGPPKHISVTTLGGIPESREEPVRVPWHF
ncbi:hypothetical protein ABW21_db0209481 [Orbilia brochopaga]|nr:hypothetical protein ABW21_db0209481 [Drechslerella brochopaga]